SAIALIVLAGAGVVWYANNVQKDIETVENLPVVTTNPSEDGGEMVEEIEEVSEPRVISLELTAAEKKTIAGWKTYQNEELGFELKHPSDWWVKESRSSFSESNSQNDSVFLNHTDIRHDHILFVGVYESIPKIGYLMSRNRNTGEEIINKISEVLEINDVIIYEKKAKEVVTRNNNIYDEGECSGIFKSYYFHIGDKKIIIASGIQEDTLDRLCARSQTFRDIEADAYLILKTVQFIEK
ncbi:MAG: hypothetical protein KC736_05100, partial [Candidatus Moranbacteria bacterium]|nr:hypothetical protein [Candidatus Moranbacteria bacterium]